MGKKRNMKTSQIGIYLHDSKEMMMTRGCDGMQRPDWSSLLGPRTTDTSTNNAGKLLTAHGVKQANAPADNKGKEDGEGGDEPEGHDDVLLLACGTAPASGLLQSILGGADVGLATASVALAARFGGVLVSMQQNA